MLPQYKQYKQHKEHKQLKQADKAQQYLDLLDTARCNGKWQDTSELTRKVAKHASHRQCLILAAQIERTSGQQDFSRLMTAPTSKGLTQSINSLLKAIEKEEKSEKTFKEDVLQARTCLAWLYATNKEYTLALAALPPILDKIIDNLDLDVVGTFSMSWTHVCILKGEYIKCISLEQDGKSQEAPRVFKAMSRYVASVPSKYADTLGHRCWTEQLLTGHCQILARGLLCWTENHRDQKSLHKIPFFPGAENMLGPFRQFAQTWRNIKIASPELNINKDSSTRTWKAYYDSLSSFLQQGIVEPMFKSKSDQRIELEGVQADYEVILLKEVQFPKADQTNLQMEAWIDQVMANWHVLSSRSWHENDLGQGGRDRLNRTVLAILYRASQKTFLSPQVLRNLFVVHSAMAEFLIARKALRSYFEVWGRETVRSQMSGQIEAGLDDDDTALRTAAAGVLMLCNYGHRKEVKEALDMAEIIEKFLSDPRYTTSSELVTSADDVPKDLTGGTKKVKPLISNETIALGYHALGVAQARWSRLMYENSRSELLNKAIVNFRLALQPKYGEDRNPELLFSYAHALASSRDLVSAIVVVKDTLSENRKPRRKNRTLRRDFASGVIIEDDDTRLESRNVSLRFWHLLALLLSARQDFASAVASCEAALDLYGSKSILYGDLTSLDSTTGLSFSERRSILELKMTQLAIMETSDGPAATVNTTHELISMFKELFKYEEKPATAVQQSSHPPSTANGTLRSVRGSILGLPLASSLKAKLSAPSKQTSRSSSVSNEESITLPTVPALSNDGATTEILRKDSQTQSVGRQNSNRLRKRSSRRSIASPSVQDATNLSVPDATSSSIQGATSPPKRPSTSDRDTVIPNRHLGPTLPPPFPHKLRPRQDRSKKATDPDTARYDSEEVGVAISHDLPSGPSSPVAASNPGNPLHVISSTAKNTNQRKRNTNPVSPKPSPSQLKAWATKPSPPITIPAFQAPPEPRFAQRDEQRHELTLLIKIWCFISALYQRASMPPDSQGAITEAIKVGKSIEASIVAYEGCTEEYFTKKPWANPKSHEELQADVLTEKARLHWDNGEVDLACGIFEQAVSYFPNHVDATTDLCEMLLNEWDESPPQLRLDVNSGPEHPTKFAPLLAPVPLPQQTVTPLFSNFFKTASLGTDPPEEFFYRLAARDRAYGLLSMLVKTAAGSESPEAWSLIGRAYEASGMVDRAKQAYWWVMTLGDSRGVREFSNVV